MTGKTHATIALALSAPLVSMSEPRTLLFIPFALYGSLVPDMDAEHSTMQTATFGGLFLAMAFILLLMSDSNITFLAVILLVILSFAAKFTRHKTIMHSLLGMAIFSVPVFITQRTALPAFLIGYGSHLLGDCITGRIPILYPNEKEIGIKVFSNNSGSELSLRYLFIIALFLFLHAALS